MAKGKATGTGAAGVLIGSHLRDRRLALSLRQADVAQAAGISAPYLNLIEHSRRRATSALLQRLAVALGLDMAELERGAGGALLDDLRAAAAALPDAGAEVERLEDFAGRFRGWAQVIAGLMARSAQLERSLTTLNDRMTHDPFLSASLHEILQAISSVRSTAAILADSEEIEPEWRAIFHRNLHQDSERLAKGAEALVAYLDGSDNVDDPTVAAPQEEVENWLSARGWQVAELEDAGGRAVLEAEVAGLASVAARDLAARFLDQAAKEAQALPLSAISGDDPAQVAAAAGVSVLTAMRRMALAPASRLGLVLCDASGTMIFRKPVDGFTLPRFGAACPLWPLFSALARPMVPIAARLVTSGRAARGFDVLAISEVRLPQGFHGPELREAGMLLIPRDGGADGAMEVGSSCRICARADCPARREASIVTEGG